MEDSQQTVRYRSQQKGERSSRIMVGGESRKRGIGANRREEDPAE
jgi:hypothetical protein